MITRKLSPRATGGHSKTNPALIVRQILRVFYAAQSVLTACVGSQRLYRLPLPLHSHLRVRPEETPSKSEIHSLIRVFQ